ncbi:MAG TPA: hypothetical protein EYN67_20010 [Flavobacteriales bacterium]|nr:hypothetical protein [Flavobacteriales bacterium]
MKKSEILKIIREEVEVVLTNEEAIEVFDLNPAALLDEICGEDPLHPSSHRELDLDPDNPYAAKKRAPGIPAGFHDDVRADINDPDSESEYAQLIRKFRDRAGKR